MVSERQIRFTSVPNPKFASFCGAHFSELRIRKDTSKIIVLVWFWIRSSLDGLAANTEENF